ncbi:MAG: RsmB/NOP family class I SAM-dependent RNA methyltransferase [Planctomycetes bacterium]|nr:RsmB/NOP family class I SAM-dependent RNA methyltransferase [Planctomycetota bacterium]
MDRPPDALTARLAALGDALQLHADALLGPRPRRATFRFEARRRPPAETEATLRARGLAVEPLAGLPGCAAVPAAQRDTLTRASAADDGALYVLGASSVRAARALEARGGERVLDLAAAPGGKTLVLAEALADRGELVAVDAIPARFHRLRANLDRAGATFVETLCCDGRRVPRRFHDRFDRVLLDAPCSSEARIDPDVPATFANWSLGKIRDMARKQWGLLGTALRCVKPGGEVVYCTCSLAPEENEATVAAWLGAGTPEVELLPVDLGAGVRAVPGLATWGRKRWPDELALTRRIVPDRDHEALFVARLRRLSG